MFFGCSPCCGDPCHCTHYSYPVSQPVTFSETYKGTGPFVTESVAHDTYASPRTFHTATLTYNPGSPTPYTLNIVGSVKMKWTQGFSAGVSGSGAYFDPQTNEITSYSPFDGTCPAMTLIIDHAFEWTVNGILYYRNVERTYDFYGDCETTSRIGRAAAPGAGIYAASGAELYAAGVGPSIFSFQGPFSIMSLITKERLNNDFNNYPWWWGGSDGDYSVTVPSCSERCE